ncbi:MAG TPA: ATP-dependent metallopeptidase FtsH/Yme1/Tma family protein, partial [Anaeromyxobacter sp.]|nr:ATP-dependent metallopeptidase FtsH/Yme1/Tma family protein [Anaeromyxobacter sp.]
MRQSYKTALLWIFLIVMFVALWQFFEHNGRQVYRPNWTEFTQLVEQGKVASVTVKDLDYSGELKDEKRTPFQTTGPVDVSGTLAQKLIDKGVVVTYQKPEQNSLWVAVLLQYLPLVFVFLLIFFFMRQLQSGGGKAMSFGKSRAKLMTEHHNKVTFSDVAGIDESRDELEEIISFLKDPKKFTRLGGRIPKGVLLMGPPGTGKTLLARAVAGEAGVAFFSLTGSEFVEMFVGVGAARVRDLFEQARKAAPCIIFIDELDALGRSRSVGGFGGTDEKEQTLNQLLAELDGFDPSAGVILLAATNRPEILDQALLRAGRFDRQITVSAPDLSGRLQILRIHSQQIKLSPEFDLDRAARMTPGFSGADLANIMNEAALLAARRSAEAVSMPDFE